MTALTTVGLMEAWCRLTGKYAMLVSFPIDDLLESGHYEELFKAAPYLSAHNDDARTDELGQLVFDGHGVLAFDTFDEMNTAFKQTVGDDGPTKSNPYDGEARVYALTCGPDGLLSENT